MRAFLMLLCLLAFSTNTRAQTIELQYELPYVGLVCESEQMAQVLGTLFERGGADAFIEAGAYAAAMRKGNCRIYETYRIRREVPSEIVAQWHNGTVGLILVRSTTESEGRSMTLYSFSPVPST